jgi:ABC-type multidrug transport system permease subunit
VAYVLPVTHGIRLAQDVMLHGWINAPWHAAALAGIAAVLLFVSWVLLRRGMTRL